MPNNEVYSILMHCHNLTCDGNFNPTRTTQKVLDSGFYWPTILRDAYAFCETCYQCKTYDTIFSKQQNLDQLKIPCEAFDIWGIEILGPFTKSNHKCYIIVAMDFVSKWVEIQSTRTNSLNALRSFIRSNIFIRYGVPRAIITDQIEHLYKTGA